LQCDGIRKRTGVVGMRHLGQRCAFGSKNSPARSTASIGAADDSEDSLDLSSIRASAPNLLSYPNLIPSSVPGADRLSDRRRKWGDAASRRGKMEPRVGRIQSAERAMPTHHRSIGAILLSA
jgi:hypothetical protein